MKQTRAKKPTASVRPDSPFLDLLSIRTPRGKRGLTAEERRELILMLAHKSKAPVFDLNRLAPPVSFPRALLRHFDKTDISYAMPLF